MMTVQPEVQLRAQKEIDEVIGENRVPCIADQVSLPYIRCIIKELLRFNPPVPITIHSPTKDDIYGEYSIPKGWSLSRIDSKHFETDLSIFNRRLMGNGEHLVRRTVLSVNTFPEITSGPWRTIPRRIQNHTYSTQADLK